MLKLFSFKQKYLQILQFLLIVFILVFCLWKIWHANVVWRELIIKNQLVLWVLLPVFAGVNWFIEYLKWKLILTIANLNLGVKLETKALVAGVASQFVIPLFFGNVIGRLKYIPSEKRGEISTLVVLTNISQFIPTFLFGLLAILWLELKYLDLNRFLLILIASFSVLIGLFVYFSNSIYWFSAFFFKGSRPQIRSIRMRYKKIQWFVLFLSIARYVVFCFQFLFMFRVFGFQVPLFVIMQFYILITLIPYQFLGKIGIREVLGLAVFTPFVGNPSVIIVASIGLWALNNVFPILPSLIPWKR